MLTYSSCFGDNRDALRCPPPPLGRPFAPRHSFWLPVRYSRGLYLALVYLLYRILALYKPPERMFHVKHLLRGPAHPAPASKTASGVAIRVDISLFNKGRAAG